jgi:5'-deoxynucleotidase YfbR-like HD superfamily hydrolase
MKNLALALQAPYRYRWQIVKMLRNQSIAEHMWRTWVIGMALYDALENETNHNTVERTAFSEFLLIHDLPEIMTGDLPTTVKSTLNELCPGAIEAIENRHYNTHGLLSSERIAGGVTNTYLESLWKIADILEAMLYLMEWSPSSVNPSVHKSLDDKICDILAKAKAKHTDKNWDKILPVMKEVIEAGDHP